MKRITFEGTEEQFENLKYAMANCDNSLPKIVDEYVTVITGIMQFVDDEVHARECNISEIQTIEKVARFELGTVLDQIEDNLTDYIVLDDYDGLINTDTDITFANVKQTIDFTVTKHNLTEWYFNSGSDQEQKELISMFGYMLVESLMRGGTATYDIETVWETKIDKSVVPISITEQAEQYKNDASYVEVGDIVGYTITLIS